MDYLVKGDTASINKLSELFGEICQEKDIRIGKITRTLIMIKLLDRAKEAGIFTPIEEGENQSETNQ